MTVAITGMYRGFQVEKLTDQRLLPSVLCSVKKEQLDRLPGSFPQWEIWVKDKGLHLLASPNTKACIYFLSCSERKRVCLVWIQLPTEIWVNERKMSRWPAPKSMNTTTQAKCSSSWAIVPLLPRRKVLKEMYKPAPSLWAYSRGAAGKLIIPGGFSVRPLSPIKNSSSSGF